jgi:hypothetical protein
MRDEAEPNECPNALRMPAIDCMIWQSTSSTANGCAARNDPRLPHFGQGATEFLATFAILQQLYGHLARRFIWQGDCIAKEIWKELV